MCKKQNMCSNDMIHFYIYGPIFIVSHDLYIASDVNNNIYSLSRWKLISKSKIRVKVAVVIDVTGNV